MLDVRQTPACDDRVGAALLRPDDLFLPQALDELWHRKYAEDKGGTVVPVPAGGAGSHGEPHGGGGSHGHGIHLPGPSYYPLIASLGFPLIGYGIIYNWWLAVAGGVVLLAGLYGWALEPSAE